MDELTDAPVHDGAVADDATPGELDELRAELARQQQALDAQQRQLDALRARLGQPDEPAIGPTALDRADARADTHDPTGDPGPAQAGPLDGADQLDRRAVLRRAGLAAGAVAGAAAGAVVSASPAAAVNGGNVILGQDNTASLPTTLTSTSTTRHFVVRDSGAASVGTAAIIGITQSAGWIGVLGRSTATNGFGVAGRGGPSGAAAWLATDPAGVHLYLEPQGQSGPDRGTSPANGSLVMDGFVNLWAKVSGLEWRKLVGPDTAGALHVLAVPKRVFDSRAGQAPLNVAKGTFVNQTKTVDAKNNSSGVPVGATAVLVNLAVTNTNSGGFGALWAAGAADPGTASINWGSANTTISNSVVTAVDAAASFSCKIAGSADVIIDVVGYYR